MRRDDDRVLELFTAAVNEAGGLRRMVDDRRLGWMPALMESACTLVLQEVENRDPAEIAEFLSTTSDAVESMLSGPADVAPVEIYGPPPGDDLTREHIAGGLVRHAWSRGALGHP